jgi:hypothetical protein
MKRASRADAVRGRFDFSTHVVIPSAGRKKTGSRPRRRCGLPGVYAMRINGGENVRALARLMHKPACNRLHPRRVPGCMRADAPIGLVNNRP